ncbi:signal peptidase I [Demequina globuliformis]|uniref:signal peptidase I n=1 Tax=Demequina globuliformis TaxID=676202 RepID=UPI0007833B9A|nr:signal peptidase I [Demequina globuliformis]
MTYRRAINIALTAAVAIAAWLFVWPETMGGSMTYITVSGPSMEPLYESGDFVAARKQDSYAVGDVVVFTTGSANVIHRIVDGDGDSGFITQGDNNDRIDMWETTGDEVLGKAVIHVPGAGDIIMLIRHVLITPPFTYFLAAFVFLVLAFPDDKKKRPAPDSDSGDDVAPTPADPHSQPQQQASRHR